jgi:hypothetical protein
MLKLKYPLELLIYPKEIDGCGIYSIAKLKNDEECAVTYHYETEKWEILSEKWKEKITSENNLRVAEEILQLNGVGWVINKKF